MSKYLYLSIFIVLSVSSLAQLQQPNRYEILQGREEESRNLLTCDKSGILLWRTLEIPTSRDSLLLELEVIDTTFTSSWRKNYLMDANLNFIAQKYFDGKAYLLFGNYTPTTRNLVLIEVEALTSYTKVHIIKNIIPFTYFGMEVTGEAVIIGGYFNYRPLVLLFDFEERIPRILPGLFNDKTQLVQMQVNENKTIDVILQGKNAEKVNTLFINTFDAEARLLKVVELEATKRKALLFGRSKSLDGPAQLVAGVYGKRNSEYSRGIFMANINQFGENRIKYYNYAEFENFFNYMRAKREERVKRRIERKKIKNKKIRFNYRLLVHDLIEHNDQFILLGEAFYPQYKNVQNSSGVFSPVWSVNRGMFSYNRIFEGYRYTHAVVIGFDKQGNVLWDNSFEIKDVLSPNLDQYVHANIGDDKINLLYVFDDNILSKVISGNEVLEGKELFDVRLQYEEDRVGENDTRIRGLQRWYDDIFVTYGTQRVKNLRQQGVDLNRDVFFINKIVTE